MNLPEPPLAEGRVARIYPWKDGQVLKLAREWVPADWIEYEYRITTAIASTHIPTPNPVALLSIKGRPGIVFERVDGPTMLDRIGVAPHKALRFGRMMGKLHATLHQLTGPADLPENLEHLRNKIESVEGAPENLKQAALQALDNLPEGHALLHGDFHPGNILLGKEGPVIIDWPDATRGHPLADVARSVILANMGGLPPHPVLRAAVGMLRTAFRRSYLQAYFRISPYRKKDLQAWLLPVLFARLAEGIEEERTITAKWLQKLARSSP